MNEVEKIFCVVAALQVTIVLGMAVYFWKLKTLQKPRKWIPVIGFIALCIVSSVGAFLIIYESNKESKQQYKLLQERHDKGMELLIEALKKNKTV